jgi:DNA-binding ferritin-like protein
MNSKHILNFVAFNANLQIAHWQADTKLNTHKALGDLYDEMIDLTDKLAEVNAGKIGNTDFDGAEMNLTPGVAIKELLAEGMSNVAAARAELTTGIDDDLMNILADMSTAINRALYFIKP